jgi:hypothetical protein
MNNVYVLSDTGHIAIARSIIEQELYLAWGKLIPKVAAPTGLAGDGAVSGVGTLPLGTHQYAVTAYNDFGETTISNTPTISVVDGESSVVLTWSQSAGCSGYHIYRWDAGDSKFKRIGSVSSPTTLTFTDTGFALTEVFPPAINSTCDDPWTTTPPAANPAHTKLYNEVGRRRAITKKYVTPDVNGDIDTPNGRWSESLVPTRHIYLQVGYALTDAADQTLYQMGAFVGTTPASGFENSNYLLPGQIAESGTLFALSNVSPIYRNSSTREIRELVITF